MKGNIFVIGLGLIGGSLAMAIRQAHENVYITGYDVQIKNIQLAKLLGMIDHAVDSIEEGALEADLIILAVPVDQTEEIVVSLAGMKLKKQVIVTDAGSTKSTVVDAAKPLIDQGITFIGGHPMAGKESKGFEAASKDIFSDSNYICIFA